MTSTDSKVSCIAFGFTLGFGFLTAWDAWKITSRHKWPLRSLFVWMVWGELAVNLAIAIIAWLFLEGVIKPTLATFFMILCLWVIEIQFIMQIVINRVALITRADSRIQYIRWGTVAIITVIEITVFCIWIPAHLHTSSTYIKINNVWDKITKVIILIVDCGLNYYFIVQVKRRLIRNGLQKYNDLVRFNTRIIIISVGMDFLIIGTMFLKNGVVFLQFHPVAYIVKLKIELSMTNLITKIATDTVQSRNDGTSDSRAHEMIASMSRNKRLTRTVTLGGNGNIDDGVQELPHAKNGVSTHVKGDVERGFHAGEDKNIHLTQEVKTTVAYADGRQSERTSTQGSREYVTFEEDDQKPLAW